MAYPQRLLTDDESVIADFHPHWRTLIPAGLWTVLAVVALVVVNGRFADAVEGAPQTALNLIVVVAWLALAGSGILRWRFTQYVLTTERIVARRGIVSRSGTEIPLESISNVLFNQRVIERLLGFGDVLVESAGSQGQSALADIPDPESFQSQVYRAREERTLHFESGRGSSGAPRDRASQLSELADLRDRGVLSDAEFRREKRRLLDES